MRQRRRVSKRRWCRACPSKYRRHVTNNRLGLCTQCSSFVYRHTLLTLKDKQHMSNFIHRYTVQKTRVEQLSGLLGEAIKYRGDPYKRYAAAMARIKKKERAAA